MSHAQQRSVNDCAQYRIDQCNINPLENTIERDGETVKVSPRAIQVLAYLIDNAGRPITYAEINDTIWQGGCSENSFYQQIATLRKALGDSTSQPRYIKTIAKQGYMFVGIDLVDLAGRKVTPSDADKLFSRVSLTKRSALFIALALGVLLALVLTAYALFSAAEKSEDVDPRAHMFSLVGLLQQPKSTVVIELPDPAERSAGEVALLNALILITQYQLEGDTDQLVALMPKYQRTGEGSRDGFYKKVIAHYASIAPVRYILRPNVNINDGQLQWSLTSVNPLTLQAVELLNERRDDGDAAVALTEYEEKIFSVLQPLEIVTEQQTSLLNDDLQATRAFIAAARDFFKSSSTRAELERTIELSQKALQANPLNDQAYAIFWSKTVRLMDKFSYFDIDSVLQLVKDTADEVLQRSPNNYRALLAKAERDCWLDDYLKCAQGMAKVLLQRPNDSSVLNALHWNLKARPDLQLQVAKQNYELNPFFHDAFPAYRNALLLTGGFHELSNVYQYHAQWSNYRDWFVQAQRQPDMAQLQAQAASYRQKLLRPLHELEQTEQLPSRYIGYSLLNANQPALARFWGQKGMERDLPYFDLRVIELLANLWQGEWNPLSWQIERAYVMERHASQHSLDKLTIAYFDWQTGWLAKSASVLEDLEPALLDDDIQIDSGNLRLFVYYSEIKKRSGNLKYASRVAAAVKEFLQQRDANSLRGIDFGIADVEYYALNNQPEKALEQLENAVYQQAWLPNALWLWPPIEQNLFLKSLRNEPRFQAVSAHIEKRLAALCFTRECS